MNDTKSELERVEANSAYFVSLADTRGSLERLPLMALVSAFLLGIGLLLLVAMVFFAGYANLVPLFFAQIVAIGFSVVMFVLTLFRGWVFRYQILTSGLLALFAILGWVYAPALMAIGIATVNVGVLGGAEFSSAGLAFAGFFGPLYVCAASGVHVLLLRKRLREGHSVQRTMSNSGAASSLYRSKSLWTIFGLAVLVPNVLTEGRLIFATVGVLMFLFLMTVATSLPVEFGYLAFLKSRDRKYWQIRPPRIVKSRPQKKAARKKTAKWLLGTLAAIIVIGVLNAVLPAIL